MAKTIQDLGFEGNGRTIIGELVIKPDNATPKKRSKDVGSIKRSYEDFGRYTHETHKKGTEIVKSRLTMDLGVKVNGATHFITFYGEDMSDKGNKKKFKIRKGKKETEEITVPLNEAEKYADKATNTTMINLLTEREVLEIFPETADNKELFEKYKKGIRFVSTHAMIQFLCLHREKFRGRRVKISANAEMEEYNGNTRMKGFGINSMFMDFTYRDILMEKEFKDNYTEETAKINTDTELDQAEKTELLQGLADRLDKVDETITKLEEEIKTKGDSYVASIPVYIPKDMINSAIKNPKAGKLNVGIITQRKQEDGSYTKKIVRVTNYFELHDSIKNNATPEIVAQIGEFFGLDRDRIAILNVDIVKGSEQGANAEIDRESLSEGDKVLFDAMGTDAFKDIMKKSNIASGTRGKAKESAVVLGFPHEIADVVEIKDEDFEYDVNKVENEMKSVAELKQVKAINPAPPVTPPSAPAGI